MVAERPDVGDFGRAGHHGGERTLDAEGARLVDHDADAPDIVHLGDDGAVSASVFFRGVDRIEWLAPDQHGAGNRQRGGYQISAGTSSIAISTHCLRSPIPARFLAGLTTSLRLPPDQAQRSAAPPVDYWAACCESADCRCT